MKIVRRTPNGGQMTMLIEENSIITIEATVEEGADGEKKVNIQTKKFTLTG
jgi:hypothetical protein